jgi:hypothetical protein
MGTDEVWRDTDEVCFKCGRPMVFLAEDQDGAGKRNWRCEVCATSIVIESESFTSDVGRRRGRSL